MTREAVLFRFVCLTLGLEMGSRRLGSHRLGDSERGGQNWVPPAGSQQGSQGCWAWAIPSLEDSLLSRIWS